MDKYFWDSEILLNSGAGERIELNKKLRILDLNVYIPAVYIMKNDGYFLVDIVFSNAAGEIDKSIKRIDLVSINFGKNQFYHPERGFAVLNNCEEHDNLILRALEKYHFDNQSEKWIYFIRNAYELPNKIDLQNITLEMRIKK